MLSEFLDKTKALIAENEPFAIAMVVRRQEPSSGKPGDRALIREDGALVGWIGGGCTKGIILKEAVAAIREGKSRIVRISPDEVYQPTPGIVDYAMTCHSGGTVEVYIEPIMPKLHLLVIGKTAVSEALVRLAKAMDYRVTVTGAGIDKADFPTADVVVENMPADINAIARNAYIVVCTQGHNDVPSLAAALKTQASYVAFVASRKKANAIFADLRDLGFTAAQMSGINTPAGLDIKAKLPEEVAVSILAQIIQHRRSNEPASGEQPELAIPKDAPIAQNPDIYINPVCGIPVQKSTAKYVLDYSGDKFYFCCDCCKEAFEKEPDKYAAMQPVES